MPLPSGTVFNAQLGSETADEDESTDLLGRQGRADFRQEDANVHLDTFCALERSSLPSLVGVDWCQFDWETRPHAYMFG